MEVHYRSHRPSDYSQLKRLWEEGANWGEMSEDFWRRHILEAPDGGPFICVATDTEDQVLGGMAFQRRRFWLHGEQLLAARPIAPIVSEALRQRIVSLNPVDHPVVQMFRFSDQFLRDDGCALSYSLPDPNWRLLLKLMPGLLTHRFPLWSLPLPLPAPLHLPDGYSAERFEDFGAPLDALWERARGRIGWGRVRDSTAFSYHAGPDEYDLLGVRRDGEWVGVVAARKKGEPQWVLCDLIAVDEAALQATLTAAVNRADSLALSGQKGRLTKVALLVTPMLAEAAAALGFTRDRYDFIVVLRIFERANRR
jgi:hypothetical protein